MTKISALILFLLVASAAHADCNQFYPMGNKIVVPNSVELCNSFYAVEFDTVLNAPIISAEKFRTGGGVDRTNNFHADRRLDKATRADNADYLHSGYDQGHMTPAGDATTPEEMSDTFLLSNMTPQQPTLNREAWRLMEMSVRKLHPDYIVTGNIYSDKPETIGAHHVPVPVGYYKLVWYQPNEGQFKYTIAGYCANNQPKAPVTECSVDDIEKASGLKFH